MAMVEHLRFSGCFYGQIREVLINRTAGTWFACFCIEDGQPAPPVKDGPRPSVWTLVWGQLLQDKRFSN